MNRHPFSVRHCRESLCHNRRAAHGPTSFDRIDQELVFKEIGITPGCCFLDLGCGLGDYAIHASTQIGDSGLIYALDIQPDLIDNLETKIKSMGIQTIKPMVADITHPLPIETNRIDICLISTVLHIIDLRVHGEGLFREIHRVLNSNGRLIAIDCKKEHTTFGPPLAMRVSPDELAETVLKAGFQWYKRNEDLGNFYMVQFKPDHSA
ncbi:MAG: class I SAM-dependent methyltransferase [Candidatus Delongbacteria bacterium]|nr:class I SAM-dependent methyltransferase [Candidatus Delongbacteria bacterium]